MDLSLLYDPCGGLVVGIVLFAIGLKAIGNDEKLRRIGAAIGGIVFFTTLWIGVLQGGEVLAIVLSALAWASWVLGTTYLIVAILAGVGRTLRDWCRRAPREEQPVERPYVPPPIIHPVQQEPARLTPEQELEALVTRLNKDLETINLQHLPEDEATALRNQLLDDYLQKRSELLALHSRRVPPPSQFPFPTPPP